MRLAAGSDGVCLKTENQGQHLGFVSEQVGRGQEH